MSKKLLELSDKDGALRWSYSRGHIGQLFDSLTDYEQESGAQEVKQLWLNCCLLLDETGEADDEIQEELANGFAHQSFAHLTLLSLCTNSLKVRRYLLVRCPFLHRSQNDEHQAFGSGRLCQPLLNSWVGWLRAKLLYFGVSGSGGSGPITDRFHNTGEQSNIFASIFQSLLLSLYLTLFIDVRNYPS